MDLLMIKTITVISDTHCYKWKDIHPQIKLKIKETDYSVHCGDYVRKNVLDEFILNSNNPIVVHGNSDPVEIRNTIPYTQILKVNEITIGIIHPAWGKEEFKYNELFKDFPKIKPDVIFFGHTHEPINQVIDETLFINPGQAYPSFLVPATMAVVTIDKKNIYSEIKEISPAL
ncbi:MAG: hypothetical protein CL758_06235 [Chloroflexi bacterium]|nr:hypothetical protein [Chloroflexota bacterium]|tara:strand:- start:27625 stop:28143 length:519 start_codon:yes stop_codon:yes gene_type:complete